MQLAVRITLSSASPEPTYTGGPFASGVAQLDTANPPTSGWQADRLVECGTFGERVDIATGGNYGQLLDSEMSISNHDKWFATFQAAGAVLEGALVEVGEALSSISMTTEWVCTIADASFQGGNVEIRVENILAARHKVIPARTLTAQEFPGLPDKAEGQAVPTLYGGVSNLVGTPLVSDKAYYDDACISRVNLLDVSQASKRPTSIWVTVGANSGILIEYQYPGISISPSPSSYPSWVADVPGGDVYIEITDGAGSGQSRQVTGVGALYSRVNTDGATLWFLGLTFAAAWDPLPGSFDSVMRVYAQDLDGVLIVADEASVLSVLGLNDTPQQYPVPFVQGTSAAGVTADLSAALVSGSDIETIIRIQPEIYDDANVVDGILSTSKTYANVYAGEVLPGVSATDRQISPWYEQALTGIRGFMKAKTTTAHYSSGTTTITQYLAAVRVSGIYDVTSKYFIPDNSDTFPPWIIPGGTATDLTSSALVATARNIAEYARVNSDLEFDNLAHGPIYDAPLSTVTFTNGSATLTMSGLVDKAHTFSTAGAKDLTLCKIRPKGCPRGQWIGIASYVTDGTFPMYANAITLSAPWPYATFSTVDGIEVLPADQIFDVQISEIGIGLVVGGLNAASEYRVAVSSGRTFSASWPSLPAGKAIGDPITLARDAALDMLYRDLGLGAAQVDFASFQALSADPITSALVERIDSAQRLADLCQQFNWVVGHDSEGRETATAWLSRVGSEEYDYSIDTGDVVEGTLTGVSVSDITDMVNCPNVKYDWTQADGFRQESNVVDVTADPLTLNAGNYLRYLTGFGDFATALDVYESLHASYKISNRKNTGAFEMADVADASGVLWPLVGMDRFSWMASRKPLFVLTVPDTSAAAFPTVGKRARVRHKRYAPAWVYGTIVEWTHDPMAAETELVVMVDPGALSEGLLYVDTIDPSGVVPLYTDMADGTTTQYIDQTGA